MDVIDHTPHSWYLLRDGDRLLLDMNVSQGAYSRSVLLELSDSERDAFEASGRAALDELAAVVQYSAPLVPESGSPYRDRDLAELRGGEVHEAISRWRSAQPR